MKAKRSANFLSMFCNFGPVKEKYFYQTTKLFSLFISRNDALFKKVRLFNPYPSIFWMCKEVYKP
jgi:hypothetical protein